MDEVTGTPELETPSGANQETATEHDDVDLIAEELSEKDESTASDEIQKEAEPQPRKLRVKIDGQELEVDEEEAAKGYQRQADYSRNMQKLQAEQAQAKQARETYQQRIEQYIPEQEARLHRLQQELAVLAVEDPAQWVAKQQEFQTEVLRYQQANGERERLKAEDQERDQRMRADYRQRTERALVEAIPEWKNSEVGTKEIAKVFDKLEGEAAKFFGDQAPRIMSDIRDGLYGPIPFVLAHKALQYDALMAKVASRKASKAEETTAPAPVQPVKSSGGVAKDPTRMTDAEFAAWRRRQIAQRN